jgi:hypothetical protein
MAKRRISMDLQVRLQEIRDTWRDFIGQASRELCYLIFDSFCSDFFSHSWRKDLAQKIVKLEPDSNADLALRMAALVRRRVSGNFPSNIEELKGEWGKLREEDVLSHFSEFVRELGFDTRSWLAELEPNDTEIYCVLAVIINESRKHFGQEPDERLAWCQKSPGKAWSLFEMFGYGSAKAENFLPTDMGEDILWQAGFTAERLYELAFGLGGPPPTEAEIEAIDKVGKIFFASVFSNHGMFAGQLSELTDPGCHREPSLPLYEEEGGGVIFEDDARRYR